MPLPQALGQHEEGTSGPGQRLWLDGGGGTGVRDQERERGVGSMVGGRGLDLPFHVLPPVAEVPVEKVSGER